MTDVATKTSPPAAKTKAAPKRPAMTGRAKGKASLGTAAAAAGDLPLDMIDATHWSNPRGDVDRKSDAFLELVSSIKEVGVLQPIVVGPALVEGGKHPLIAGWRRFTAATVAKLPAIPVRQVALSDAKHALVAAIAENVAREEMSPLAEATAIHLLMTEHGYTQVQAGKEIGMSERTVRERLRLLKINDAVPAVGQAIAAGTIPMDAAVQLQLVADTAPNVAAALADGVKDGTLKGSGLTTATGVAAALGALARNGLVNTVAGEPYAVEISGGQVNAVHLPLTGEQLQRYELVTPLESWRTTPPPFRFDEADEAAARTAGCLLELRTTDRWNNEHVELYITDEAFLRAMLEPKLAAMEKAGEARSIAAHKAHAEAAAAKGQAGAAGLTDAQKTEAQKVREKAARDKELAHHKNVILGERLQHGLDKVADSVEAAQLLALLVLDDADNVLARGQRYTDPACLTEEVKKNGSIKRTYELPKNALDDVRDEILAAQSVAAAIAPVLRALALGRHADDQVVAQSSRSYWVMRGAHNYWRGPARSAPTKLDGLLQRAGILENLTPAAKARAAAGKPLTQVLADPPAQTGDVAGPKPAPRTTKRVSSAKVLDIVKAQPGATIPEIAQKLGIAQNYLYRVLPELQKDGKVTKDGRGWHPAAVVA